jgi:hypothetical protein
LDPWPPKGNIWSCLLALPLPLPALPEKRDGDKGDSGSLKRVSRRIIQATKPSKSMPSLLHAYRMAMVCCTWLLRLKPGSREGPGHRWCGGLSTPQWKLKGLIWQRPSGVLYKSADWAYPSSFKGSQKVSCHPVSPLLNTPCQPPPLSNFSPSSAIATAVTASESREGEGPWVCWDPRGATACTCCHLSKVEYSENCKVLCCSEPSLPFPFCIGKVLTEAFLSFLFCLKSFSLYSFFFLIFISVY